MIQQDTCENKTCNISFLNISSFYGHSPNCHANPHYDIQQEKWQKNMREAAKWSGRCPGRRAITVYSITLSTAKAKIQKERRSGSDLSDKFFVVKSYDKLTFPLSNKSKKHSVAHLENAESSGLHSFQRGVLVSLDRTTRAPDSTSRSCEALFEALRAFVL